MDFFVSERITLVRHTEGGKVLREYIEKREELLRHPIISAESRQASIDIPKNTPKTLTVRQLTIAKERELASLLRSDRVAKLNPAGAQLLAILERAAKGEPLASLSYSFYRGDAEGPKRTGATLRLKDKLTALWFFLAKDPNDVPRNLPLDRVRLATIATYAAIEHDQTAIGMSGSELSEKYGLKVSGLHSRVYFIRKRRRESFTDEPEAGARCRLTDNERQLAMGSSRDNSALLTDVAAAQREADELATSVTALLDHDELSEGLGHSTVPQRHKETNDASSTEVHRSSEP